jgi:hypothetical protein
MIGSGEDVVRSVEHKELDTIVLGTPSDYMNASSIFLSGK